ncbi:MAG: hypothetical protein JWM31_1317 [Solirubrobacterales bacterium]|nr:hypothetical protein [Solirubrobacterales bacterium]
MSVSRFAVGAGILALALPSAALAKHGSDDPAPSTTAPAGTTTVAQAGTAPQSGETESHHDGTSTQSGETESHHDGTATESGETEPHHSTGDDSASGRGGGDAGRTRKINVRGSVVSVDATAQTLVIHIARSSHHRALTGDVTISTAQARLRVADRNADGVRDLKDFVVADAVRAEVLVPRRGPVTGTLPARRVEDRTAN